MKTHRQRQVVAVLGLSGVGKTTQILAARTHLDFCYMHASTLIADERRIQMQANASVGSLGDRDLFDPAALLASSFHRRAPSAGLIVLDGHTLISTPNGYVTIHANFFAAMDVIHFIFLFGRPATILQRRHDDKDRERPMPAESKLRELQERSLRATVSVADQLGKQVTILNEHEHKLVGCILRRFG